MINDIPWGTVVVFTLFCLLAIGAFAEGLSRQKDMQRDIKEIRDAVQVVARKAGERISKIEGQLENVAVCPTKDRRSTDRRSPDDWLVDSNFQKTGERKSP
jgi:hypothetical protein